MKSINNLQFFLYIFLLMSASSFHAQTQPGANLIITNAKVWTVDKQHPAAEAVAVVVFCILAGGRTAKIYSRRGPHTKKPCTAGHPLTPCVHVAHVHFATR